MLAPTTYAEEPREIMTRWFGPFVEAVGSDHSQLASLLHDDCYWRNLLSFGWKLQTLHGVPQIKDWLASSFQPDAAKSFRLTDEVMEGALGAVYAHTIDSFFSFETTVARGRGHIRLVVDPTAPHGARAVTLLTSMRELIKFPEAITRNRPRQFSMSAQAAEPEAVANPDVVIVGAGQAGLMLAARLKSLNVKTLIVERAHRVGDIWRNRYRALKLHNEIFMNHFPYLHFPESWPVYIPRDKMVSWLEFYAESMDLNVATDTTFLGASFDANSEHWTVRLQHPGKGDYVLNPKHVVLAAGVSGLPEIPQIRGRETFNGRVLHSSEVNDSLDVKGKSMVVVGAGTSAHDIAQMSHLAGADVTLVQRSSTTVVSLEPSGVMPFEIYRRNDGLRHIDEVDLIYASVPIDLVRRLQIGMSRKMMDADQKLLEGLRSVGFLLDNGEDDTGWVMKLIRYQAGYYLNIGASELIIEKKIRLKAGVQIAQFDGAEVVFSDGSRAAPDIVVFATGYRPLEETVSTLFGKDIAERVGPIYGVGADGEVRGMYARTGQPGFYATGGGLAGARSYSRYIALLIKAQLEGLLPFEKVPPSCH